jgi:hypothetical protein
MSLQSPNLADGADTQLLGVPGADACWQLGGTMRDFGIRCLASRVILIVTFFLCRDD